MSWNWRLSVLALTLSAASTARATERAGLATAVLDWRVEEGTPCLDPRMLESDVDRRLGRPVLLAQGRADLRLLVRATLDAPNRIGVQVELTDDAETLGTRALDGNPKDCPRLRETLALVVGMLLDAPSDEIEKDGESTESPKSESALVARRPELDEPARPAPKARSSNPWRGETGALFTVSSGVLPRAGVGARADVVLRRSNLLGFRAGIGGERGATVTHDSGAVDFVAMDLGLAYCPVLYRPLDAAWFLATGWATVTGLFADASGFDVDQSGSRWVPAIGVGLGARYRLFRSAFVAAIDAEAYVPFSRPAFTMREPDGTTTLLHQVSPFGTRATLGILWEVP